MDQQLFELRAVCEAERGTVWDVIWRKLRCFQIRCGHPLEFIWQINRNCQRKRGKNTGLLSIWTPLRSRETVRWLALAHDSIHSNGKRLNKHEIYLPASFVFVRFEAGGVWRVVPSKVSAPVVGSNHSHRAKTRLTSVRARLSPSAWKPPSLPSSQPAAHPLTGCLSPCCSQAPPSSQSLSPRWAEPHLQDQLPLPVVLLPPQGWCLHLLDWPPPVMERPPPQPIHPAPSCLSEFGWDARTSWESSPQSCSLPLFPARPHLTGEQGCVMKQI